MKAEELIKWAYVKPGTLVEVRADLRYLLGEARICYDS